jgi:prolyl-tRNA synthetase
MKKAVDKKEIKQEPKAEKKETVGITAKKVGDFSDWYTQVIQKAELAEYTDVSGCYVFRPTAYSIWEKVQKFFDGKIKKSGVKNAYFPLFIPEHLFTKEKEHVQGFTPEVAWVTHHGEEKLAERLAVRPTSETIMYDAYAKWIRSHRDLPLRLNQWCNIVRWEFRDPVPFLRSREFLWQEGHTVFATQEEADKENLEILEYYRQVFEELYAIPAIKGKKSDKEKFAGANYTLSVETFLPNGKAIQGSTAHGLGQNFSKAFGIEFLDEAGNKRNPWQNSWGISTRTIGIMIMMHGDDKGLVIPPKVAPIHAVIVPIVFKDSEEKVMSAAKKLKQELKKHNENLEIHLDDRSDYTSGWKFNEWEMKGVPLRIEIGPKDIEKNQVVIVRRDTGEKAFVAMKDTGKTVDELLEKIQQNLFAKAKKFIADSTVEAKDWKSFENAAKDRKLIKTLWCGTTECEEAIKYETDGIKTLNIPFDQPKITGKCVHCGKPAKVSVYFAKSY